MTGLGVRSDRAGQGQRVEAIEELRSARRAFESGQRRPEAEVRSESEADVRVGITVETKLARIGPEDLLGPVG